MSKNESYIEFKNVNKSFNGYEVLKNINLSISKGQKYAILGPNGAGKSTLFNLLCGVIAPDCGEINISYLNPLTSPEKVRLLIGRLSEDAPLYENLTVKEQIELAAGLRGISRKTFQDTYQQLIDDLNLASSISKLGKNLSKGIRRRAALALALIGLPEILILDEPFNGLDPQEIVRLRILLEKLQDSHTLIISSHILPELNDLVDHIVILKNGELIHQGKLKKDEINYKVSFISGNETELIKALNLLPVKDLHVLGNNTFYLKISDSSLESLLKLSIEKNQPLLELKPISADLEKLYLDIIS